MSLSFASSSAGPLIELKGVSLRFRPFVRRHFKHAVLDIVRRRTVAAGPDVSLFTDLSLSIGQNERVGVIGANGAGKSTLLKLIAGIYPPSIGCVRVLGRLSPILDLGAGFNLELSGAENILLNGAFLGFGRREMQAKIGRILAFADLEDVADTPAKYYSSGMLLRLAFAIATDVAPEILLVDEILAVGDGQFSVRAVERMRSLLDGCHIAVLVSHNLELVANFCSRVIWLEHGRVIADGPARPICEAYAETFSVSRPAAVSVAQ